MSISIKLEAFEGPLDLLLHLIDKNKVNIYDIPIVLITEQYMEYMEQIHSKDMDTMSEFLVMAATLARIKSKMLLPKEETEDGSVEEDPRRELVERLLEYKMFKYMSYELKDKQLDAAHMLFKEPTIPKTIQGYKQEVHLEELLQDLTLQKLQNIFQAVMRKQVDKLDPIRSTFGRIEKEDVNQEEKMLFVKAYAREHGAFYFQRLLEKSAGKMEVVVTFLSVLELMKMGYLQIQQECLFGDILVMYTKKKDGSKEGGSAD